MKSVLDWRTHHEWVLREVRVEVHTRKRNDMTLIRDGAVHLADFFRESKPGDHVPALDDLKACCIKLLRHLLIGTTVSFRNPGHCGNHSDVKEGLIITLFELQDAAGLKTTTCVEPHSVVDPRTGSFQQPVFAASHLHFFGRYLGSSQ